MKRAALIWSALFNLAVFALLIVRWRAFDYMGFYATGKLASAQPDLIFNESAQRASQAGISVRYLPFLHLPHEIPLFSLLGRLPLSWSMAVWTLLNLVCLLATCWMLSRLSGKNVWLMSAALFPVMLCFMQGQDSFLLLLLTAGSLWLVNTERDALGGGLLALSLFKPQLGLVIAFAMLVNRRWRFVSGFAVGLAAVITGSVAYYGPGVFRDLFGLILRSQSPAFQHDMVVEPANYPTLRGLAYLFHIPTVVVFIASLALVAWCARSWYSEKDTRLLFSSAVVVGCLVAFNWHRYDLVVLLIPLAFWPNLLGSKIVLCSPVMAVLSYMGIAPLICLAALVDLRWSPLGANRWRYWQEHQSSRLSGSSDGTGS